MSYLQEVDAWLEKQLEHYRKYVKTIDESPAKHVVKHAIKEKILESYRNGQKDVMGRLSAILKEMSDDVKKEIEEKLNIEKQPAKPRS